MGCWVHACMHGVLAQRSEWGAPGLRCVGARVVRSPVWVCCYCCCCCCCCCCWMLFQHLMLLLPLVLLNALLHLLHPLLLLLPQSSACWRGWLSRSSECELHQSSKSLTTSIISPSIS